MMIAERTETRRGDYAELRAYAKEKGFTPFVQHLAKAMDRSSKYATNINLGREAMSARDIENACSYYGIKPTPENVARYFPTLGITISTVSFLDAVAAAYANGLRAGGQR